MASSQHFVPTPRQYQLADRLTLLLFPLTIIAALAFVRLVDQWR